MLKNKKSMHESFEGRNPRGSFTKLTHDMLNSSAWKDLNPRQRYLYLHLKSKYRQKRARGYLESSNQDNISLPKSEWTELYGDYRTFIQDIRKLEDNGFIRTVRYGKATHQCNLYGFIGDWDKWTSSPPPP
jgi:hypothetical protein